MGHSHQAGSLKQSNKRHKNATSSKRAKIRGFGAGKVSTAAKKGKSLRELKVEGKLSRLNQQKQKQKTKTDDIWLQKRLGSLQGPPKIVGVVPISQQAHSGTAVLSCVSNSSWNSLSGDANADTPNLIHAVYKKFRTKCSYLAVEKDLYSILEGGRVSDIMMFLIDARDVRTDRSFIDEDVLSSIAALQAQGIPDCVCCIQNIELINQDRKFLSETKNQIAKTIRSILPSSTRTVYIGHNQEVGSLGNDIGRLLSCITPKDLSWRSIRPYMLPDSFEILQQSGQTTAGTIDLKVCGYLRGVPLSANSLMHIPGGGTGRLESVTPATSPFHANREDKTTLPVQNMKVDKIVADSSLQDSLVRDAEVDTLLGEQTWPTEDELNGGGDKNAGRDRRLPAGPFSIPAGMSTYQADWFVDEDGQWNTEERNESEDDKSESNNPVPYASLGDHNGDAVQFIQAADDGMNLAQSNMDEADDMTVGGSIFDGQSFAAPSRRIGTTKMEQFLEDEQFPDEIDTPVDQAARMRFARFRALQSFRSSPWHPKENLPLEYSKIFQFENFGMTQRRTLNEIGEICLAQKNALLAIRQGAKSKSRKAGTQNRASGADDMEIDDDNEDAISICDDTHALSEGSCLVDGTSSFIKSGSYVELIIRECPSDVCSKVQMGQHISIYGLHPHENKLSVLHFNIQRCKSEGEMCEDDVIKSKDELIFQAGFRSFKAKSVFSEANLNCDKNKYERFLRPGRFSVASCFGPITFLPCPLLVFKEKEDGRLTLVATGSLGSVDPDRIMLKRVVLSGYPMRCKKKFGVIRHMFYDPTDVRWFKPAELTTKFGLRGNIREPLGTKGLFKAIFSGPIKQNDTILLTLYKRVFPKYSSDNRML
jgi:pre-rRNA-processing protein TSR1